MTAMCQIAITPVETSVASSKMSKAEIPCPKSINLRRSNLSAYKPPNGQRNSEGMPTIKAIMPTQKAESVNCRTSHP